MEKRYVAKIYFDEDEIAEEEGDNLDELYSWMLLKVQGKFGNLHGDIVEIKTGKIVKSFHHCPSD